LPVPPRVAIIVLNWNRPGHTAECLESLQRITYQNFRLIVVDNGSTDRSVETLRQEYPELTIVCTGSNLGYTGGNNAGARIAVESVNPDYLLILNNDAVVEPGFLTALIESAGRDRGLGLVQPKLLYYGSDGINSTGGYCDIFGATSLRGVFDEDANQYDAMADRGCFYLSGACLLVTRNLLETIGTELLDELLFMFHDDVDLSWHARLLGFALAYCPTSKVFHKEGGTAGEFNSKRAYLANRNRIRVLVKNHNTSPVSGRL
jgi:GT2 family glycosyltransferase